MLHANFLTSRCWGKLEGLGGSFPLHPPEMKPWGGGGGGEGVCEAFLHFSVERRISIASGNGTYIY